MSVTVCIEILNTYVKNIMGLAINERERERANVLCAYVIIG